MDGDSWDPSKFNVSRVLQLEPFHSVRLLLQYKYIRKKDFVLFYPEYKIRSGPAQLHNSDLSKVDSKFYKEMLIEMFDYHLRNSTYRRKLDKIFDDSIARKEKFDEVLSFVS